MSGARVQVLVVGAGPTGLALANALQRYGVDFRIIDKIESVSPYSKALGVQAGTLEAIADMMGEASVDAFVARGVPASGLTYHVRGRAPVDVLLDQVPSKYNYILILPQSETEKLLGAALGDKTERGLELTAAVQNADGVVCTIVDKTGVSQACTADYVVGCDGAHSAVRHAAAIDFAGKSYRGDFTLADVRVRWPFNTHNVHLFVSDDGIVACFPLPTPERYRIMFVDNSDGDPKAPPPPLGAITKQLSTIVGIPVGLEDPIWIARFSLHHRMAKHFRAGRLFLAGDAAHIHSPAGGQGMNTGIQDSFNLGHKLARVLHGDAPATILDNYERERLPVARNVVRTTDLAFRQAMSSQISRFARNYVAPALLQSRFVTRHLTRAVSEVDIARREIADRNAHPVKSASR